MENKSFWKFADNCGAFIVSEPQKISCLYFPLANEAEMMSSITPRLSGDIKTDNNSFLMTPVSRADLADTASTRNFWLYINKKNKAWPLSGGYHSNFGDKIILEAGLLYHTIARKNKRLGLEAQITNFVPVTSEHVELMLIKVTNASNSTLKITPTSAMPLFCRSAENLRDHRHVTSLLNRIKQDKYGIIVKPTMSFDERGHQINQTSYYVLGIDGKGNPPLGTFPTQESFVGEGSNFNNPSAIINNLPPPKLSTHKLSGKEAMGALRFKSSSLKPGQSAYFAILLGISKTEKDIVKTFRKFNTVEKIKSALEENKSFWKQKTDSLCFETKDPVYDNWLRWVRLQPILRKIYGCSFLPDFDYGRGGKGWRDLWQDCLSIILTNPQNMRRVICSNFSGVRIDGSNATIVTKKTGCFIADRNKISRVWMDHGLWPLFTLNLYINQTADIGILLEKTSYFKDAQTMRSKEIDASWDGSPCLKTKQNKIYKGTVLEHALIQHLAQFFNVGPRNFIRLENADWNDGLDMAPRKGESVAFSAFYAYNLNEIASLLDKLKLVKNVKNISILKEAALLLKSVNYNSARDKNRLLNKYLNCVKHNICGSAVKVNIDALAKDLRQKAQWLLRHISENEWINISKNNGFFNGYYDNKSKRLEGKNGGVIKMTLTGQVFAILSGAASDKQIRKIYKAAKIYLQDKKLKAFRLNTDFKKPQPDLGRAFSFSYGDKENGAIFSHMCVMFAYALYKRGFAKEGFEVLNSLYELAANSSTNKIYPNLPEYFNLDGRGMYSYLTGSASWYIMTTLTQAFGIRGENGNLVIAPKLVKEQFYTSSLISAQLNFAGKNIKIAYSNPSRKSYPDYTIRQVKTNIPYQKSSGKEISIQRKSIISHPSNKININIVLG